EAAFVLDYLRRRLPAVSQALGRPIPHDRLNEVADLGIQLLMGLPAESAANWDEVRWHQVWTPFLLRSGSKLLIDHSTLARAVSSLINCVVLKPDRGKMKGSAFEGQVRAYLLTASDDLKHVPELERAFASGTRTIGEADVVVRLGNTVFFIECKSH